MYQLHHGNHYQEGPGEEGGGNWQSAPARAKEPVPRGRGHGEGSEQKEKLHQRTLESEPFHWNRAKLSTLEEGVEAQ